MKFKFAGALLPVLLLVAAWTVAEEAPVRMQSEASLVGRVVDPMAQGHLFTGEWQLNRKLSDDPEQLVKEKMDEARRARPITPDSRGRDREGAIGTVPHPRSGAALAWHRRRQEAFAGTPPNTLSFTYRAPAFTVSADRGPARTWYTDSRGGSVSAGGDVDQETVTAGWEGATLVVERISSIGPGSVERYQIGGTGQLQVEVVLTLPGVVSAVEYELVYDRVAEAPAAQGWKLTP